VTDRRLTGDGEGDAAARSGRDASGMRAAQPSGVTASASRILRYQDHYDAQYGYEARLVEARQRVTSDLIAEQRPLRVVEIGCGSELLAARLLRTRCSVRRWVIVEPSPRFARGVDTLAQRDARVRLVEGFFESSVPRGEDALGGPADLVIVDGLLHELTDPESLLRAATDLLAPNGWLHVSVPNARSLHRRVARSMGLIADLETLSERNKTLEQARVYDRDSLRELLNRAELEVLRWGGHTIKPFTNEQMGAIGPSSGDEVFEGLVTLGAELPDLAAEIWMDARRAR
jgi:SAM-dependent methyltransferase